MSRVDFYILPGDDPGSRALTVCKLIEKAWKQGHTLFVRTGSAEETSQFDRLLWTFRQGSFVPHECHGSGDIEAPVIIGHGPLPESMQDVLVNLGEDIPAGFDRFQRVAELVNEDETTRQAGRRRYRQYQELGHDIQTHKLDRTG